MDLSFGEVCSAGATSCVPGFAIVLAAWVLSLLGRVRISSSDGGPLCETWHMLKIYRLCNTMHRTWSNPVSHDG